MPERPVREISRAVATRRSPSLPGLMKEMLHWAATARSLWELQANANAESANRKMKPPWAILWPLTMCGLTVIASVASPVLISRISMPRPWLASSSFHIASAQARARSSDESVALTFTAVSLRISVAACRSESDAKRLSQVAPGRVENKPLWLRVQSVSLDAKPPSCQRFLPVWTVRRGADRNRPETLWQGGKGMLFRPSRPMQAPPKP